MSRFVRRLDRSVTMLVGLAVFALGLLLFAWTSRGVGWLPWPGFVRGLPDSVRVQLTFDQAPWWPWALLVLGLVLIVVSLRWLVGHLSLRRVGYLSLPGSDEDGRLLVEARAVVDAAALAFNHRAGVETAVGTLETVDGQLVARVNATLSADADLTAVAADADEISGQLHSVLGREDLRMTYVLRSVPVRVGRVD